MILLYGIIMAVLLVMVVGTYIDGSLLVEDVQELIFGLFWSILWLSLYSVSGRDILRVMFPVCIILSVVGTLRGVLLGILPVGVLSRFILYDGLFVSAIFMLVFSVILTFYTSDRKELIVVTIFAMVLMLFVSGLFPVITEGFGYLSVVNFRELLILSFVSIVTTLVPDEVLMICRKMFYLLVRK
jgi:hypothetical protein